jgi:hypothetical protein
VMLCAVNHQSIVWCGLEFAGVIMLFFDVLNPFFSSIYPF